MSIGRDQSPRLRRTRTGRFRPLIYQHRALGFVSPLFSGNSIHSLRENGMLQRREKTNKSHTLNTLRYCLRYSGLNTLEILPRGASGGLRAPSPGRVRRAGRGAGPPGPPARSPASAGRGRSGKVRGGGPRGPHPARANSPLAAGPAGLRPLFATLAAGLRAPVDAGICPRQVTLQVLGLGERWSCRHGSGGRRVRAGDKTVERETEQRRAGGGARAGSDGVFGSAGQTCASLGNLED